MHEMTGKNMVGKTGSRDGYAREWREKLGAVKDASHYGGKTTWRVKLGAATGASH